MSTYDLAGKVIGCAMTVHSALGPGFLESVYQNALLHELQEQGIIADAERALHVSYKGQTVGRFSADMLVADKLIVENKSVQSRTKVHEVQLVNYLTATGIDEGLLLNFGAESLQFRKKFRTYRPSPTATE